MGDQTKQTDRPDRPSQRARSVEDSAGVNEVRLCGRVSADPVERELPSGARIIGFRLVVERSPTAMTRGSQQRSDWIECTAWSAQHRRRVSQWVAGDVVEVGGALRRRHYRTASGSTSIVEIEMLSGRRVRRVGDAAGS